MPETHVTKAELGRPRSAAEFAQWVNKKCQEIGETEEGRQAYRNRRGLLKEFVTEALPLATVCNRYFGLSEDVTITHLVGNQNHDALVEDRRQTPAGLEYLEVTAASESQDSAYRMRVLNAEKTVSLTAPIKVIKDRKAGTETINVGESVAVEHGAYRQKVLDDILAVAEKKSGKDYPDHTGLVIVFDPGPAFRDAQDLEILEDFVKNSVLPAVGNFTRVFISGGMDGPFLSYAIQPTGDNYDRCVIGKVLRKIARYFPSRCR